MRTRSREQQLLYQYNRLPTITCPLCKCEHKRVGRRSAYCKDCYSRFRVLYNILEAAKYRSKKLNQECTLDMQWFIDQGVVCPKTGHPFEWDNRGSAFHDRHRFAPSVDKKNPRLGYTKENCQLVCWWYNMSKNLYTDEDVLELCRMVVDTSKTQRAQNAGE